MRRSCRTVTMLLAMMPALIKRWRGASALSASSSSGAPHGGSPRSSAFSRSSSRDAMVSASPSSSDSPHRTFRFVPYGAAAPAGVTTISCDGLVAGSSFDVTHWTNNRTPEKLYADTSTEIALNLARAAATAEGRDEYAHLAGAVVLNNHYDTDGALSVFACLRPCAALEHAALLREAAEAGDFGEWSSDAGVRLDCALQALESSCEGEAEAYDRALELLPDLLREVAANPPGGGDYKSPWRPGYDEALSGYQDLVEGRALLYRGPGKMAVLVERIGGERMSPYALHRGLVEADLRSGTTRILRVEQRRSESGDDNQYRYEYETVGHGWVTKLKSRPVIPGADGTNLAKKMGSGWSMGGRSGLVSICQSSFIDAPPEEVSDRLWKLDPGCQ